MKKQFQLTQTGVDELAEEQKTLIAQRPQIADDLRTAREHGDLAENAEYHNAREDQARLEARIAEIEGILKNVEVIKQPKDKSKVELGNTVVVKGERGEQTFTIVGSVEANPLENKVSNESPIGKALLGAASGEKVTISLPAGEQVWTVKSIS